MRDMGLVLSCDRRSITAIEPLSSRLIRPVLNQVIVIYPYYRSDKVTALICMARVIGIAVLSRSSAVDCCETPSASKTAHVLD